MGYVAPVTLQDALNALTGDAATVVAGGTDVYPSLGDRPVPTNILDISRIEALQGIAVTDRGWRIGGAVTWTDLSRATELPAVFDGLKTAAHEVGSVQIQNVATLAGNLCNASPAADGIPPLLALEAEVELARRDGVRMVPLAAFVTGARQTLLQPDELMIAIHVPATPEGSQSSFLKLGSRRYLVISIAMVAVVLWLDPRGCVAGARIAVGACSAAARRLRSLEADLLGLPLSDVLTHPVLTFAHVQELSPIDDVRGTAEYRLEAAAVLCQRALISAARKLAEPAHG